MAPIFRKVRDVAAALQHVDDPDVLVKAAAWPALMTALEVSRPPNWWGLGIDGQLLLQFSRDHGVPLAWVPRREIVNEFAQQSGRVHVEDVVNRRSADIIADCAARLLECDHRWVKEKAWLADRAIKAFQGGHEQAAAALATVTTESLARWASQPRVSTYESRSARDAWERQCRGSSPYQLAALELDTAPPGQHSFLTKAVMAPIPRFFTPWRPETGDMPPAELSRHVVAHVPTREQVSGANAVISIMLMTSLLRHQQDWSEQVDDGG